MTEYVVGFLFRNNNTEVALIRKTKPDWQRGKLNGIGGKIEPCEGSCEAMAREFNEETGWQLDLEWDWFLNLTYSEAIIHFFRCDEGDGVTLTSVTDETVDWFDIKTAFALNEALIPNLRWLIPLALDKTGLVGTLTSR